MKQIIAIGLFMMMNCIFAQDVSTLKQDIKKMEEELTALGQSSEAARRKRVLEIQLEDKRSELEELLLLQSDEIIENGGSFLTSIESELKSEYGDSWARIAQQRYGGRIIRFEIDQIYSSKKYQGMQPISRGSSHNNETFYFANPLKLKNNTRGLEGVRLYEFKAGNLWITDGYQIRNNDFDRIVAAKKHLEEGLWIKFDNPIIIEGELNFLHLNPTGYLSCAYLENWVLINE